MEARELRQILQVDYSMEDRRLRLKPDPDFEEFARDCIRLARQEKSPGLRRRLLTLAREWMNAAMHPHAAEIRRTRSKVPVALAFDALAHKPNKRNTLMGQKQDGGSEKQGPLAMKQPLKKHEKVGLGRFGGVEKEVASRQTGGAGEPQAKPLEPEKQGGIGGP
jgi:hypothetical protein